MSDDKPPKSERVSARIMRVAGQRARPGSSGHGRAEQRTLFARKISASDVVRAGGALRPTALRPTSATAKQPFVSPALEGRKCLFGEDPPSSPEPSAVSSPLPSRPTSHRASGAGQDLCVEVSKGLGSEEQQTSVPIFAEPGQDTAAGAHAGQPPSHAAVRATYDRQEFPSEEYDETLPRLDYGRTGLVFDSAGTDSSVQPLRAGTPTESSFAENDELSPHGKYIRKKSAGDIRAKYVTQDSAFDDEEVSPKLKYGTQDSLFDTPLGTSPQESWGRNGTQELTFDENEEMSPQSWNATQEAPSALSPVWSRHDSQELATQELNSQEFASRHDSQEISLEPEAEPSAPQESVQSRYGSQGSPRESVRSRRGSQDSHQSSVRSKRGSQDSSFDENADMTPRSKAEASRLKYVTKDSSFDENEEVSPRLRYGTQDSLFEELSPQTPHARKGSAFDENEAMSNDDVAP